MEEQLTFTIADYDKAVEREFDEIMNNPNNEGKEHGVMMFMMSAIAIASSIRHKLVAKQTETEEESEEQ